jgi:hypothetical protein
VLAGCLKTPALKVGSISPAALAVVGWLNKSSKAAETVIEK